MRLIKVFLSILFIGGLFGCDTVQVKKDNLEQFSGIKKGEAACKLATGGVYKVRQPREWVIDGEAGKNQNFCLVAYPSGATWEDSLSVIYLNHRPQKSKNFKEWVHEDIERFKKETPALKVGDIKIGENISPLFPTEVKTFITKFPPSYEKVAYINPPGHVVVVVLNSKSKDEFEASQPAFDQIIRSFEYFR